MPAESEREEGELHSDDNEGRVWRETHDAAAGAATSAPRPSPVQRAPQLRLVKRSSDILLANQRVAIVDALAHREGGVSIGRDRVYGARIRLPSMQVSKHHANLFPMPATDAERSTARERIDKQQWTYAIVDTGSTHGTFVWSPVTSNVMAESDDAGTTRFRRLSEPRVASQPFVLSHLDVVRIGETVFQVHLHGGDARSSTLCCNDCALAEDGTSEIPLVSAARKSEKATKDKSRAFSAVSEIQRTDSESIRRKEMSDLRSLHLKTHAHHRPSAKYVDRAAVRRERLGWHHEGEEDAHRRRSISPPRPPAAADKGDSKAATVSTPIHSLNRGLQMFQAMSAASSPSLGVSSHSTSYTPPVIARGTEGRAGLGSKPLLDVEEIAQRDTQREARTDYKNRQSMLERQRQRYDHAARRG